jgi:hypothetical protein
MYIDQFWLRIKYFIGIIHYIQLTVYLYTCRPMNSSEIKFSLIILEYKILQ